MREVLYIILEEEEAKVFLTWREFAFTHTGNKEAA